MTGPSTNVGEMQIQFNDYYYKKGRVENPIYSYVLKENMEKPNPNKPGRGTWEITRMSYYFVNGKKADVEITDEMTDEERIAIAKVKQWEENRLNRKSNKGDMMNLNLTLDSMLEQPSIDNPMERFELREYLENAINQLPDKQQKVIRQRYFGDMPTIEIAKIEGVEVSAISHREKRALANLRKILAERQLTA